MTEINKSREEIEEIVYQGCLKSRELGRQEERKKWIKMFEDYNEKLKNELHAVDDWGNNHGNRKGLIPIKVVKEEIDKLSKEVMGE